MNATKVTALVFMLLGLVGCVTTASNSVNSHNEIVSAYTIAYNNRDLAAMTALMHPDIQWLSVEGDQITIFANGKTDLTEQMSNYMSSPSATTSTLAGSVKDDRFFAVREIASWMRKDGAEATQSALAVYEISDGLIRRVWYYPATR